jgi:hypothetical protein
METGEVDGFEQKDAKDAKGDWGKGGLNRRARRGVGEVEERFWDEYGRGVE